MSVNPMQQPLDDIPVMVVDDARFTLEMIRRVLKVAGFTDIRVASTGAEALAALEKRRAGILIADWIMPAMDGLELTRRVRAMDGDGAHYSYVILLTGSDHPESLGVAFSGGVDDFISKSPDNQELVARLQAAGRISRLQRELIGANRRLRALNRHLDQRGALEAGGRIGNRPYLVSRLHHLLQHASARGGALWVTLVGINGQDALARAHGDEVVRQVLDTVGRRLEQTSRPVDVIGRMDESRFALVMESPAEERCHANAFRRVHQALNLRAYRTTAGYITAGASIAVCRACPAEQGSLPDAESLLGWTAGHLASAATAGRPLVVQWQPDGGAASQEASSPAPPV